MAIFLDVHNRFQERLSKREAETLRLREERDKLENEVDLLKTMIDALREENESIVKASRRATTDFLEEMERIHSGASLVGPSQLDSSLSSISFPRSSAVEERPSK